jgi:heterotetrameric sarcosine oxidase delta subunit
MILIRCPWCGPRGAAEFHYAGEAIARPDPASATPQEWRDYLYFPANPRGPVVETWYHRMGCRRFFTVERDTATNESRTLEEGIR